MNRRRFGGKDRFRVPRKILYANLQHTCDIYEFGQAEHGSITKQERMLKHKGIKCQLSQKHMQPAQAFGPVSEYNTEAKLIICDEITIEPGSEFDIFVSYGEPKKYKSASKPFIYAAPKGFSVIDRELYLPKEWTDDAARCKEAGIPEDVKFQTKPQMALEMMKSAHAADVLIRNIKTPENASVRLRINTVFLVYGG